MSEATTIACRDMGELNSQVIALGEQGYRIVTVLDNGNDRSTIVAQKEAMVSQCNVDLAAVISDYVLMEIAVANAVREGVSYPGTVQQNRISAFRRLRDKAFQNMKESLK